MTAVAHMYTALELMVTSVQAALGPTAHWQRADHDPPRPYLIFDSQDRGGKLYQYVGGEGWDGLVTVRAIADFQDEANAALSPVFTKMEHLTIDSGYAIRSVFSDRITIPPTAEVRYAAAIWHLFIERN